MRAIKILPLFLFMACSNIPTYGVKACEYEKDKDEWVCGEGVWVEDVSKYEPTATKVYCFKAGGLSWKCQKPKGVR